MTRRPRSTSRPTSPGLAAAFDELDNKPLDQPLPLRVQEDIVREVGSRERVGFSLDPCAHVHVTVHVASPRYTI